ncbi:MAG TPA: cysteine peptidase family C39 domain-containing protein [Sedimentisphaerales bacterium]|nr:cysteine peptidase family C39 domain-containing protein [Sedimentisphaerales bacterium]
MWEDNAVIMIPRRFLLIIFCVIIVLTANNSFAEDDNKQEPAKTTSVKRRRRHPHCGLYCLYTTMKLAGKEIDFRDLVKPEYLGSRKGSSLAQLKKAADDNGLYAESVTRLGFHDLLKSHYPVILHVKSALGNDNYDHFELFLGSQNGKAELLDPPERPRLAAFSELGPRWDGSGLIVSAEPINLGAVFAPARKRLVLYVAAGITVILMLHWIKQRWVYLIGPAKSRLFGLSVVQAVGLGFIALIGGMLYHFATDAGLLSNSTATAAIQEAHLGNFVPKVSMRKLERWLKNDTVVVDARLAEDYEKGHINGAISIPVNATEEE